MNVKDSVKVAFRAHRCSCIEPCWGQVILVQAQERAGASTNPSLQSSPRSLQTAQVCPLLLRQALSWASHLTAASSSSGCQGLACLAPLLYPWCSLHRALNFLPALSPQTTPGCSVLPVSGGPKLMSFSYFWCTGQRMVVSVLIIA